jgi:hypothetical protein
LQKAGGPFKKLRGRRGIGLLWPLDLRSTPEIRPAGGCASARRPERLTGGARRAERADERLTGGAGRAARAGERLTGGAQMAGRRGGAPHTALGRWISGGRLGLGSAYLKQGRLI